MSNQKKICWVGVVVFMLAIFGSVSWAVEGQTVVMRMLDSSGVPIEGVSIKYRTSSSWYDAPLTDTNGETRISVPDQFSTITARAVYNGASADIRQNIKENNTIEFNTVHTVISFVSSQGAPIEGATAKYLFGSWNNAGSTGPDGTIRLELLPASYTFRIYHDTGWTQKVRNVGVDAGVAFQTARAAVRFTDSFGNGIEGAKVLYGNGSFSTYGYTDASGNAFKEMLPATYTFRMVHANGRVDIQQDISTDPEIAFQTIRAAVRLTDSLGNGIEGGKVLYGNGTFSTYGYTDASGNAFKELLPDTYTFRMLFNDFSEDRTADVSDGAAIVFTANQAVQFSLQTSVNPPGSGSVQLVPDKTAYNENERVDFTPQPADGYRFKGYGGPNGPEIIGHLLTMDADKSVVLEFEPQVVQPVSVSVSVTPASAGTVTLTPDKQTYQTGDVIEISVQANDGYEFVELAGLGVTQVPHTIELTGDLAVSAIFKEKGAPETIYVSNTAELEQAWPRARDGNVIILLADGEYVLSSPFEIRGDDVTIGSLNGDASRVTVRGQGMSGGVTHVFQVYGSRFTVRDMTLGWVIHHGIQIHGETDADHFVVRNVHFRDTGQQMLKVSGSESVNSNNGLVEFCSFIYTAGLGPQWYVGGVDAHWAKDWVVRNNYFEDIKSPSATLSESAVHFWSSSENTLVENNRIVDCDRGIMFGLDDNHHYGGIIRNNFIHVTRDVGIYAANTHGAAIYNNTVFVDSDYPNAVEYRFEPTQVTIQNNLTNAPITSRNGGTADLEANIDYAVAGFFADADQGDLHLGMPIYGIVDQGVDIDGLDTDFDGDPRTPGLVDIGADEIQEPLKIIVEIHTEADKAGIVADGKDTVTLSTRVVYDDGTQGYITPDRLRIVDSQGTAYDLPDNTFTSFVAGAYTVYSEAQALVCQGLVITVTDMDLAGLQPTGVQVIHDQGQTFITFDELVSLVDNETITYKELFARKASFPRDIKYHIYRSDTPITTVAGMTPIGTVDTLSGWNLTLYGMGTPSVNGLAHRYVIEQDGLPLGLSTGLFVYNPPVEGSAYYAVTAVVGGTEHTALVPGENLTGAVDETTGPGVPIRQRIEPRDEFWYVDNVTLHFYTRWEAPPNASALVQGRAFDYMVGIPSNLASPAPVGVHMHCWGQSLFKGFGWWNDAEDGSILLSSNQFPYDWWTGYHENLSAFKADGIPLAMPREEFENGVVRPYTTNRLISFLDWMETDSPWAIDRARVFTAGTSMGGSGCLMMAIRYPGLVAWSRSWVGVHNPGKSAHFKGSYAKVYGEPEYNVLFEDGTPVWDYYNDIWYLRNHVATGIGFLSFSNNRDDVHKGWEQAVDFINALQETRQPHLFRWGGDGNDQRAVLPGNNSQRHMMVDARVDQSLPAFTRCDLDDNYGNGDPADGDTIGQVNQYLYWETDHVVDTPASWEMTVLLMDAAPQEECRVDITPRRLRNFVVQPFETVNFRNTDALSDQELESGMVTADQYGLVTIEQTTVGKTGNRIVITR